MSLMDQALRAAAAECDQLKAERDSLAAKLATAVEVLREIADNEFLENGAAWSWKKARTALAAVERKETPT